MKSFCCFVAIAVCLGLSGVAHASSQGANFAANILDPSPPLGMELFSNNFTAAFSDCSAYSGAPSDLSGDYCFEGINATNFDRDDCNSNDICNHDSDDPAGSIWTSLTITLSDPDGLLGTASCGTFDTGSALFASSNCTETGGVYTLSFTGGTGIGIDDAFFIVIAGPTLSQGNLDSLSTTDVAGVVPEPNSALLLASGTGMFGLLLYAERRRLFGQLLRS